MTLILILSIVINLILVICLITFAHEVNLLNRLNKIYKAELESEPRRWETNLNRALKLHGYNNDKLRDQITQLKRSNDYLLKRVQRQPK